MKVVLDTNVVVSGTFWTGESFKVIENIDKNNIQIITSLPILKEYDKILNSEEILEKTSLHQQARVQSMHKILSKAIIVDPKEKINIVKDDPDDNKFIEAAVDGKADYIISRDKKHLLILKKFRNINIISPEDFLKLIKNKS